MSTALYLLRRYWVHIAVAAALSYGAYKVYDFAYGNGYNAANVRAEKIIAEFAKAEAAAQEKARKAEQAKAQAHAKAAEEYERGKRDAEQAAADVVADLTADRLRLRQHWQGCVATGRVSGAATSAAVADAASQLRAESAARIVRAAAEADAQVRGLQRVIEADRVR